MSDQTRRVAVCATSALAPGSAIKLVVPGCPSVAVFNVEGEFFAIDDTCTHGEASLSEGELFGDDVVCPFHSGTFCVRTGEATGYPAVQPVRVYRIVVEGDTLFAEIPAANNSGLNRT